jgi:serine protease Do
MLVISIGFILLFCFFSETNGESHMRKGYLGVSIEQLSQVDKEELLVEFGVLVIRVSDDSPAEEAGIQTDDVIQYYNGKKMRRPEYLVDAVRETEPGKQVKIILIRDGKQKEIEVSIGRLRSSLSYTFKDDHGLFLISEGGGYLGIHMQDLSNDDLAGYFGIKAEEGVLITNVEEDSPADEAGLKAGDVIVKMDEDKVSDASDIHHILRDFDEGDEIEIEVLRHKQKKTVKAILADRPRHRDIHIERFDKDNFWDDFGFKKDIHIRIPRVKRLQIPEWDHHLEIEIKEKLEKKMEELNRKMEDMLDNVEEMVRI